ncbi:uncharacterized protein MONBRDRAFT_26781 [Monosiga brevicollis MX1]|uniref:ubiquitinyl hydrolase 1 n=1 Tax=Monosiga brevicollis TaxID=81824 RepID=A9V3C8_MONBE|nr:uncharacterized protein MONBRDRAFT_26781 [Monosiga brevicollis MX1]EDQ88037.1 predicted protein [Monosiga brevicollis MX1]|eukprot:XP_001747113.1 hypothetical protein [Monosiga brevicollis MX1]
MFVADGGKSGLVNIGNTCFFNAILQCLSHIRPLGEVFGNEAKLSSLLNTHSKALGSHGLIAQAYGRLLRDLWQPARMTPVRPADFKRAISRRNRRFMGYDQQDAPEFLEFLLDELHEDVNRVGEKPYAADRAWANFHRRDDSPVVDLFQGQLRSRVCCPTCSKVSVIFDPFRSLALPLPRPRTPCTGQEASAAVGLHTAYELLAKPEVLSHDNQWYCNRCKEHRQAIKELAVWRLPPILVVHFKRFAHGASRLRVTSATTQITYPERLHLDDASGQGRDYRLRGVVCHRGTLYYGHYVAYARHAVTGDWYYYDDDTCRRVSDDSYLGHRGAYLLFYEEDCSVQN